MPELPNTPDELELRRRRARYRAEHRGTKELDLILGPFAVAHLWQFDEDQLDDFEQLLEEQEGDLQSVLMGLSPVPEGPLSGLLHQIVAFQTNRAGQTS